MDPRPLTTMDAYLGASTGLDALTHAIEAFVSTGNSPITDLHALEAIRLVSKHLLASLREPGNLEERGKMMLGSLHAGLVSRTRVWGYYTLCRTASAACWISPTANATRFCWTL